MARVIVDVSPPLAFHAMQLVTILSHCHPFPGFVYHRARFNSDYKSIEVSVRPSKGSAAICSGGH